MVEASPRTNSPSLYFSSWVFLKGSSVSPNSFGLFRFRSSSHQNVCSHQEGSVRITEHRTLLKQQPESVREAVINFKSGQLTALHVNTRCVKPTCARTAKTSPKTVAGAKVSYGRRFGEEITC